MKLLELKRAAPLPASVCRLDSVIEGSLPGEDLLSVSIEYDPALYAALDERLICSLSFEVAGTS